MISRREEGNAAHAQIGAEGRESEWVTHCVPFRYFAALAIYAIVGTEETLTFRKRGDLFSKFYFSLS